jgi:hypothetical protein
MDHQPFNPVVLSNLVKLIGVVVTWGTTIYFLWVRTPPPVISAEPFFDQVRRITMLVISVFLILSWGLLGNTANLRTLSTLAVGLTLAGICVFFLVAFLVEKARKAGHIHTAIPLLLGFFLYSTTISIGLTSAVEFLAVILLNPANATTGQSLIARTLYSARATLIGTQSIHEDEVVPFRATSGQGNVGCGEALNLTANYHLPQGASVVGAPEAAWVSTSNLRDAQLTGVEVSSTGEVVGRGQAHGLQYQEFRFPFSANIRNCPGGGHGEVVLSGKYKSTVTRSLPKEIVVVSTVSSAQAGPVWVTLPGQKDWTLQRATVEFVSQTEPGAPKTSVAVTPESPSSQSSDGKFKVELQLQQGRLGLSVIG